MTETIRQPKLVGAVLHYYDHPHVAVVKCLSDIYLGMRVSFRGSTTTFEENVDSIQYDHRPIIFAKKGEEVGIKVIERVRQGDRLYASA